MAKFFVGCRVRVVDGGSIYGKNRLAIGREGIITGRAEIALLHWEVDLGDGDCVYDAHEDCLVPILDQHQPADAEFTQSLNDLLERIGEKA